MFFFARWWSFYFFNRFVCVCVWMELGIQVIYWMDCQCQWIFPEWMFIIFVLFWWFFFTLILMAKLEMVCAMCFMLFLFLIVVHYSHRKFVNDLGHCLFLMSFLIICLFVCLFGFFSNINWIYFFLWKPWILTTFFSVFGEIIFMKICTANQIDYLKKKKKKSCSTCHLLKEIQNNP